jgi:multidrug efflux pump subunit AcrA (membrane-fusion protein)
VREEHDSVLRIPESPVLGRGETHKVYVLQNGQASERLIRTGLRSDTWVEVLNGLSEGDQVVLSHVSSLQELEALEAH